MWHYPTLNAQIRMSEPQDEPFDEDIKEAFDEEVKISKESLSHQVPASKGKGKMDQFIAR